MNVRGFELQNQRKSKELWVAVFERADMHVNVLSLQIPTAKGVG